MNWIPAALFTSVVLLVIFWRTCRKPAGFPPGPMGIPLLGYAPFIMKNPHIVLKNLGLKYGSVFSLPLFTEHVIVLHNWKSIKAALLQQSNVFSGRPPPVVSEVLLKNAGKRYTYDDKYMKEFIEAMDTLVEGMANTNLSNFLPVLRHLPGSGFRTFQTEFSKLISFLSDEVDEHIKNYQEGQARDFIDVYLAEMYLRDAQKDPSSPRSFQREHLIGVIWDLFLAGIDRGNNTLSWSLMFMIIRPDVQKKVQQELDDVVGRERLPTYADRSRLPFTVATILEIQRWVTVVPLSVTHMTTASTELFGYTIPKSTVVLENIWAVHHDPELWGDPEVFRPERFLNTSGKVQKPEYLIPFSVGERVCPGESLARVEMFLFLTCILHQFSFSKADNEKPLSFEASLRLSLKPKPFPAFIKLRK